jgi:uncharacterized protein YggU (UPF0235/DUF167 family)
MKKTMQKFHDGRTGAAITLAVDYGAKTAKIVKVLKDGTIRVDLTSVKSGDGADRELVQFLAQELQVEPWSVEILAGTDSSKLITIVDVTPADVDEKIKKLLR